ncbi:MAG: hypothetical protein U9M89_02945, partial [Patescibacteria group bacterium]|nr:hypothetical protein [Patescibacteria group bacterium]
AMQFQMQAAQMNINMLEGELNREQAENLQEAKIKFDIWQNDEKNRLDTQEEVKKLMMMYNGQGAGININDSWEDAYRKASTYIESELQFERDMDELDKQIKVKSLNKPYYKSSGGGGLTPSQIIARDNKFWQEIDNGIKRLEQGVDWGQVWERIRSQFPEMTNEEIDQALGGGTRDIYPEGMSTAFPTGQEAWGWARKGAYEEWKAKRPEEDDEFSFAKLAKGASNAGMTIEEFKKLDIDTQNSYMEEF